MSPRKVEGHFHNHIFRDVIHALRGLYYAFVVLILFSSCSSTKFIGQHGSLFPLEEDENILVLECSGLKNNTIPDALTSLACVELYMVDILCRNNNYEDLSPECVMQFKRRFNSGYIVVPRTTYFRPGSMIQYVSNYQATVRPPGLVDETESRGVVTFDIYDTHDGVKINTFDVSVKTRGWDIGNRRDNGYTTVNVVSDDANLSKARMKGLKDIAKRVLR